MKLELQNVGQLNKAEVEFGDLTVLVGPQASGKSIFLQFLKLMIDGPRIIADFKKYGYDWGGDLGLFLNLYLGEGMQSVWTKEGNEASVVVWEGASVDLANKLKNFGKAKEQLRKESMLFIPAQRVLSLNIGWPRHFTDFAVGDPYVVPCFSEKLRMQMEAGLGRKTGNVFPQEKRLKSELRKALDSAIFHGFSLKLDRKGGFQKRLVLQDAGEGEKLPFMVWSAGQREFIPLLIALYWLCPSAKIARRDATEWVIVEEPEMGLHPEAISAVMLVVLELLLRGYRVVLSTHSPHVLDVLWGLRTIQHYQAAPDKVIDMFGLRRHSPGMKKIATAAIGKEYRVFYFYRSTDFSGHKVRDISALDPGAENPNEANWGGLTEFSGRVGEVVAKIISSSSAEEVE
ncbi:MAG: ATP-binding protein [Candidatus Latescibacter sp.]|nr:ATP-binding protein [Candidatus Latescibacter sp.]